MLYQLQYLQERVKIFFLFCCRKSRVDFSQFDASCSRLEHSGLLLEGSWVKGCRERDSWFRIFTPSLDSLRMVTMKKIISKKIRDTWTEKGVITISSCGVSEGKRGTYQNSIILYSWRYWKRSHPIENSCCCRDDKETGEHLARRVILCEYFEDISPFKFVTLSDCLKSVFLWSMYKIIAFSRHVQIISKYQKKLILHYISTYWSKKSFQRYVNKLDSENEVNPSQWLTLILFSDSSAPAFL